MAQCELSGKASVAKNLVSHSNIKTKSRAFPNIQSKKFFSYQLKNSFRFKVASSTIRDIDKAGSFDVFIMRQKDSRLSPRALKVKKQILKKTKKKGRQFMKLKIKVGDEVQVIAGSDKGRKGSVLEILPHKKKIRVKEVHVQTLFDKKEGIKKREGFIDYSNVKLVKSAPVKDFKKSKTGSKKDFLKSDGNFIDSFTQ